VAAVAVGQGEVGEVVDPMTDLGREEGVGVVRTVTMTTPMEVLVVVQEGAAVAVAEQEGEEEVHPSHHPHHPLGHRLPQTIYWTRNFSLVSSCFALHFSGSDLVEHR